MSNGALGFDPDRLSKLGDRFFLLTQLCQGAAQVIVGVMVVGIDPNRGTQRVNRLLQFPLAIKDTAEPAMSIFSEIGRAHV